MNWSHALQFAALVGGVFGVSWRVGRRTNRRRKGVMPAPSSACRRDSDAGEFLR